MNDYFEGDPLRIGSEPQLLIDDGFIEDRWRLNRELQCPSKHVRNPVLIRNRPWEGDLLTYHSVLWDKEYGKFRIWYTVSGSVDSHLYDTRTAMCYAESDDGIEWEKPLMDFNSTEEHAKTNILYRGSHREDPARYGVVASQVFKDEVEPDLNRRHKMICYESRPDRDRYRRGVNLGVSPDGFRWSLAGKAHILDYNSDALNHIVWDPERERWLLYCRPRCTHATGLQPQDPVPGFYPEGRHTSRRVAVMTSRDFLNWSYPRTCLYPDEQDPADYDNACVFRAGGHFLMLYAAMDGDGDGTKDTRIASSRDGVHWERFHTRIPFLPQGKEGEWDAGAVMRMSACPPLRQGNNLMFYYAGSPSGQYDWHGTSGIGVAVAKVDRFVVQMAGDEPGYLITKEFLLEGNRLHLNTSYKKNKEVRHELRAAIIRHPELGEHGDFQSAYDGFSLDDCDPMKENGTEAIVSWGGKSDLGALRGKPVYLRFMLRNMGVFSFQVDDR
jgi:hypothetical protein